MTSPSHPKRTGSFMEGWITEKLYGFALKNILPQSLYGRSLVIIVTPVILLQFVVTYVFLDRHWQLVTRKLSNAVVREIALISRQYENFPGPAEARNLTDMAWRNLEISIAFLPGETLPEDPAPPGNSLLENTLAKGITHQIGRPFWIDTRSHSEFVDIRIEIDGGIVRALPSRSRVYASNSHIFLVWMAGTSVVLIAISILFLRNQIRPIQRLAKAAENFGKGRDVEDFKPSGATEVRAAAQAFIQMRARIKRQIEQRTTMLAGVSHDLRTPLTRFKLQLALLGEGTEVSALREDVREMEDMLETYLAFVHGDREEIAEPANLSALLRTIRKEAARHGVHIDASIPENLILPLQPQALKRCLGNLVENARKYAGKIALSAFRQAHLITVIIDDDGPGIAEENREDVFRPFYRLDEGRNLDYGGTGLGLAIARDIARSHGGEIHLQNSPLGGLRVVLHLPV